MTNRKIQATKNHKLFKRSDENRPLDMKKHRKLEHSLKTYGFLPCFPIVCVRDDKGELIVKDGQHRLAIAETLGLPVHWIEEEIDFDVALINCTAKTWTIQDYAQKFMANGRMDYQEGLEFASAHHLPVGTAFALLGGTTTFSNIQEAFLGGTFRVKDRSWADAVAAVYGPMAAMSGVLRNARFIEACMAACRVPDFDGKRLIAGAERCREKLVNYTTREAYLDMMEQVYNFGRKQLIGLKAAATMAMRERNFAAKQKDSKRPAKKAG